MIAAAEGRHRVAEIEDLVGLRYGVRTDQPGSLVRDFQTAQRWQRPQRDGSAQSMPLSYRYYLADAVFVAGVEGEEAVLRGIQEAIRSPVFPLYLGRRSCPPTGMISLGLREGDLDEVMRGEPWQASLVHQRRERRRMVELEYVRDAIEGERGDTVRDVPLSFNPERREYAWRTVVRPAPVEKTNPYGKARSATDEHDPLDLVGGA